MKTTSLVMLFITFAVLQGTLGCKWSEYSITDSNNMTSCFKCKDIDSKCWVCESATTCKRCWVMFTRNEGDAKCKFNFRALIWIVIIILVLIINCVAYLRWQSKVLNKRKSTNTSRP